MKELSDAIIHYAYIPVLVTAAYALLVFRRLDHELRILSWFIFFSAVVQVVSAVLWYQRMNNLWLLHLYVAIGFLILSMFYYSVLRGFIGNRVFRIGSILFILFVICNAVFVQGLYTYASHALTVESVLIIILSLSTYILMMDDLFKTSKTSLVKSLNWINSGLFIYYASSLLLFYFGDRIALLFSRTANLQIALVHFLFLTIMHICFFVGLWHRPKN